MGFIRKDTRHRDLSAEGIRTLEEPMEATLADSGGMARMTWSITGSREAGTTWLVGTIEFVGFGIQVFLDDPMVRFDQLREFGQELWRLVERKEGELAFVFEPFLSIKVRAPSRLVSRFDVDLEFTIGTDARVSVRIQTEGMLSMAFVEALDRALEVVDDLD